MNRGPVHPGEVLSEKLDELGISPTELVRQIAAPPNRISQIINGKRHVSADTALRLPHWFGKSAQFWTNLQNQFDLAVAREKAGEVIATQPTRPKGRGDGNGAHFRSQATIKPLVLTLPRELLSECYNASPDPGATA